MLEPSDSKYAIDEIDALHVVKVSNNGSIESNLRDAPSAYDAGGLEQLRPDVAPKRPDRGGGVFAPNHRTK